MQEEMIAARFGWTMPNTRRMLSVVSRELERTWHGDPPTPHWSLSTWGREAHRWLEPDEAYWKRNLAALEAVEAAGPGGATYEFVAERARGNAGSRLSDLMWARLVEVDDDSGSQRFLVAPRGAKKLAGQPLWPWKP
jgi:hypothetical protein